VIPARSGSKGLYRKNLRQFNGMSLVEWAIERAKQAEIFDKVVVSSDDWAILGRAIRQGVEIDWRPAHLATDDSPVTNTMKRVCFYNDSDYVMLFEPTAPLLPVDEIQKAAQALEASKADVLVSVCPSTAPLGFTGELTGRFGTGWLPKEFRCSRQEIPERYQLDGNLYMGKWEVFAKGENYWDTDVYLYLMDQKYFSHVDTEYDLKLAEAKWRINEKLSRND